jgi:uncharacterized protein YjdB
MATITVSTVDGGFTDTAVITVLEVNNPIAVTGVLLTPETAEVDEGANLQLTAVVQPADATNQQINWSSDNTAVATVDSNGLVSAISPGMATITVSTVDGGFTDTAVITVLEVNNPIAVTGVLLTPETAEVDEGSNLQLTAVVQPADATNQQINWSSDNTAVATVDSNGLVSAISPGMATITVSTVDGGFTDTAVIRISSSSNSSNSLLFAPNPYRSGETLTINGLPESALSLYLFDEDGKLVKKLGQEFAADGSLEVNISDTRQGLYFLLIQSTDSSFEESIKLFIE